MTEIDELQEERRLCSICDDPMIEGQAFHGIRQAHWDCAQQAPAETPARVSFVHAATEAEGAMGESRGLRPQPRMPEPGPTTADVRVASMDRNARQVESRQWAEVWRTPENGRTSIGLECPFCFEVVKAYVWSLPNGKRCLCGAFHGRLKSTHWRQAESSADTSPFVNLAATDQ